MELTLELVRAYAATFIHRWDRYPLQQPDGRYIQVKKPLTIDLVAEHLLSDLVGGAPVTLGAYALDAESQASWICLDADDDEQRRKIARLVHALPAEGVTSYIEMSRRGIHLWLFIPTMPGADARRFGKQLLAMYGIAEGNISMFPKQDRLLDGPGSFVRLPLGVHRKTGKVYPFVTLSGDFLAIGIREQMKLLADPVRVPRMFIDRVLARTPDARPVKPTFTHKYVAAGEKLSEAIKSHISVYDFVSQYVALDKLRQGHCPFHDDQIKSFSVNIDQNYWRCFAGCGGGSIIDFWMRWRETSGKDPDFHATVSDLALIVFSSYFDKA